MSYTQIMYHIVFATKGREPTLTKDHREELFRYIRGIIKNSNGHLYRMNGVEDHIHILASLHPSVCLADLVKDIKTGSSKWIKEKNFFPAFSNWQDGYAAFSQSFEDKDALIEYIKNQEEHHRVHSFTEELIRRLDEAGIEYDPKYLS